MNTQTQKKKLELIQWLATLEDSAIINKLLKFRDKEVKDCRTAGDSAHQCQCGNS